MSDSSLPAALDAERGAFAVRFKLLGHTESVFRLPDLVANTDLQRRVVHSRPILSGRGWTLYCTRCKRQLVEADIIARKERCTGT